MAKRTIYFTVEDMHDGDFQTRFFESQRCIDLLVKHNSEHFPSEADGSFEIEGDIQFSSPFNTIETEADVLQDLKDQGLFEVN